VLIGLARGDDEVGRELDFTQEVGVLQGHIELIVHLITS